MNLVTADKGQTTGGEAEYQAPLEGILTQKTKIPAIRGEKKEHEGNRPVRCWDGGEGKKELRQQAGG